MEDSPLSAADEEMDCREWSVSSTEHRMRLRPWLEKMLNNNLIKGLEWIDDQKTCFKIPWKHRSKKDWDTENVKVFKEWAKHTGKYHEGEEPDYVAMKTRLRCAFNKAQDIEEVKQLHSLKSAEPYRVYRFIQKPDVAAWEKSMARQRTTSSSVCKVFPTIFPQNIKEDESSSDAEVSESDDNEDEILGKNQGPEKVDLSFSQNTENESHMSDEMVSSANPLPTIAMENNCLDSQSMKDAAKVLLSLKSNPDERRPLVIMPLQTVGHVESQMTGRTQRPSELISHLLGSSSSLHQNNVVVSSASQLLTKLNGNELPVQQLVLKQQQGNQHQLSNGCIDNGQMSKGCATTLPPNIVIKSEPLSPESLPKAEISESGMTHHSIVDVVPTASIAETSLGVQTAEKLASVIHIQTLSKQAIKDGLTSGHSSIVEPYLKCNVRWWNLKKPMHSRLSLRSYMSSLQKNSARKQQNTEALTFSNHGNIMATGMKNTIKQVIVRKETVLCEEMLRMREAYGVPVQRSIRDEVSSEVLYVRNVEKAISTVVDTESSSGSKSTINCDEKEAAKDVKLEQTSPDKDYEILDLRLSMSGCTPVKQENVQVLDLSIKRNDEDSYKPAYMTQEGALDLTLKRKNEDDIQSQAKRTVMKKGSSLTVIPIYDLSTRKDKDLELPAGNTPVAVDLTHPQGCSEVIKSENDQQITPECNSGDHNYFSTTPVTRSSISQGIVVLETDTIVKECELKLERTGFESDTDLKATGNQVPTLVTENDLTDEDERDYEHSKDDEIEEQEHDLGDVDEDNDTKLAAKQLLELSNRCHLKDRGDRGLPSEELINAAENKLVKKRASYSGNNWGADLNRKSSPLSNSAMSQDKSGTRQRLRPWLESKISSGEIKGLEWIDKEKGIFKIPWKHGGKHDWTPDNSRIFMEWAKHTGRYREGIDDVDYATWKTRLRCAFNKAPDIEELKELTDLNCSEPYRVYKLVPKKELQRFLTPVACAPENYGTEGNNPSARSRLPIVVEELDESSEPQYPSDLTNLPSSDIMQIMKTEDQLEYETVINEGPYPANPATGEPDLETMMSDTIMVTTVNSDSFMAVSDLSEGPTLSTSFIAKPHFIRPEIMIKEENVYDGACIRIELKYQNQVVVSQELDGQHGCFVSSSAPEQMSEENLQVLLFPPKTEIITRQDEQIKSLLPYLKDGILIKSMDGSIFATRFCQCGVFHVSAVGTKGEPTKLKRNENDVVIFDFQQDFQPALRSHIEHREPVPNPSVHLTFGQLCRLEDLSENIVISLTVTSMKALKCLSDHGIS